MGSILTFFTGIWSGFSSYFLEIIIVITVAGGIYLYWNHLENEVTTLTTQNVQLQSVVNTQNQTITKLQQDYANTQKELDGLNGKYSQITTDTNTQSKNFDVGSITDANKATVEQQANTNINNIFTDINNQTLPTSFDGSTN